MTGYKKPSNKIVVSGTPLVQELKVETAANMYAGRLVKKGTNDDDVVACTEFDQPLGFLGYEQTHAEYRPTNVNTIFTIDYRCPILSGGGFVLVASTAETAVNKGQYLSPASAGQLKISQGIVVKRYAFVKATTVTKLFDIPADAVILDMNVEVTTAVAGSAISVGDEDNLYGFIDGLKTDFIGYPPLGGGTASAMTTGTSNFGTYQAINPNGIAGGTFSLVRIRKGYPSAKACNYITSNSTGLAGYIIVTMLVSGAKATDSVAVAEETISSAGDIMVRSLI